MGKFGPVSGLIAQNAVGRGGDIQHPPGRRRAEYVQRRAFERGGFDEFAEHTGGHWPVRERFPAAVPPADAGVKLALTTALAVPASDADGGQQQRIGRMRKQPDDRLPPGRSNGQAQVEERGTARDVHGAARRVGMAQHPCRVGVKLDRVIRFAVPEPPRLSVVHRRRGHGGLKHVRDRLPGGCRQLDGRLADARDLCRHVRSIPGRVDAG